MEYTTYLELRACIESIEYMLSLEYFEYSKYLEYIEYIQNASLFLHGCEFSWNSVVQVDQCELVELN